MDNKDLIKKANIQQIAEKGGQIYERVKGNFEPGENGKFLAIDIDSGDTYLASTSSEAVERARKAHPDKVFYVVKIGFSAAETLARLSVRSRAWLKVLFIIIAH